MREVQELRFWIYNYCLGHKQNDIDDVQQGTTQNYHEWPEKPEQIYEFSQSQARYDDGKEKTQFRCCDPERSVFVSRYVCDVGHASENHSHHRTTHPFCKGTEQEDPLGQREAGDQHEGSDVETETSQRDVEHELSAFLIAVGPEQKSHEERRHGADRVEQKSEVGGVRLDLFLDVVLLAAVIQMFTLVARHVMSCRVWSCELLPEQLQGILGHEREKGEVEQCEEKQHWFHDDRAPGNSDAIHDPARCDRVVLLGIGGQQTLAVGALHPDRLTACRERHTHCFFLLGLR